MRLKDLDSYFRSFLDIEQFIKTDPSLNGIQVANDGSNIDCAAFAVDACLETIERAAVAGAGLLFVHHGFFWGQPLALAGSHYRRISALIRHNIALYACHLPLDANTIAGNNYGLARRIGLEELQPFGVRHGETIGVKGCFRKETGIDSIITRLLPGKSPRNVLAFGPPAIKSAAIISGGAGDDVDQAIEAGIDLYITGEISHEIYHTAQEHGITVIAGGHYETETVGVSLLAEKLKADTGLKTVFIDVPTGL